MKNNIKKRKTLRRPIAIGMALVLAAAVVPKYTPVAYAATGYVIDETANSTDVSVIKGDIASQHSAIRVVAHGHTAYIKAGNVTAASEDPVSYGTSDYAIYADGIGKSGKVTLIVGDITAPKGQSIRGGAGDEGYTAFYVYKYATGFSCAEAIVKDILNSGDAGRYRDFLRLGGSMLPLDELKKAGVDLESGKPVSDCMEAFRSALEDFKKLN